MKIKLDENLPLELVDLLTSYGHQVETVPSEQLAGHPDAEIFARTIEEGRLLITQDMDFSDRRKFKPGTHAGIALIRLRDPSRRRLVDRVRQILAIEKIDDWQGTFVVISDRKLRIKRP